MPETVKAEQFVRADPAQVYLAFTRAMNLHEWLCDYATVASRPGGRMYLWWNGDFYSSGEFTALDENRRVAFTWFGRGDPGPSQVEVTLTPKDGGTQVVLQHTLPDWKGWKGSPDDFQKEWAVSLPNLASVLETGVDRRIADRPMLGISLSDFNAAIAKSMGVPVTDGMRLDGTLEGMGAAQAGLRKDDVLVTLGGKPLTNDFSTLAAALQGKKGGEEVEVVYYRGAEKKTVVMELTKRQMPEVPWEPVELAKKVRLVYDEGLAALEACFAGVSETEADFHPASGEWSAKEVLAHLIQNERHWLENLDDAVGGYERVSDDWGGNVTIHMAAIVAAYRTSRGLLDELRRLSDELVAYLAALPSGFAARKSSYYQAAVNSMNGTAPHNLAHVDQIKAAISASRKQAASRA